MNASTQKESACVRERARKAEEMCEGLNDAVVAIAEGRERRNTALL